jgi:[ribosomal protein S5]-alanine N-acetyltransferase
MNIFLQTSRLILRHLNEDDLDNLVTLDSDPDVMRFINGGITISQEAIAENFLPYVLSYRDREAYPKGNRYQNFGFWAIIEKSTQEFIGWIFLRPESDFKLLQQLNLADSEAVELGYRIRKLSWGKGYTTEVAQALVHKSFSESNINKITAWALAENIASVRVMEKAGLKLYQEYIVSTEMLPDPSLQENLLVQNLLNRPIVKYQSNK